MCIVSWTSRSLLSIYLYAPIVAYILNNIISFSFLFIFLPKLKKIYFPITRWFFLISGTLFWSTGLSPVRFLLLGFRFVLKYFHYLLLRVTPWVLVALSPWLGWMDKKKQSLVSHDAISKILLFENNVQIGYRRIAMEHLSESTNIITFEMEILQVWCTTLYIELNIARVIYFIDLLLSFLDYIRSFISGLLSSDFRHQTSQYRQR